MHNDSLIGGATKGYWHCLQFLLYSTLFLFNKHHLVFSINLKLLMSHWACKENDKQTHEKKRRRIKSYTSNETSRVHSLRAYSLLKGVVEVKIINTKKGASKKKSTLKFVVNKVVKCMTFKKKKRGTKIQKCGEGEVFPWFVTLRVIGAHLLLKHLHSYRLNLQSIHFPLKNKGLPREINKNVCWS